MKPPKYVADNTRGLESLVSVYLGLKLTKEEQVADWHLALTEQMFQCSFQRFLVSSLLRLLTTYVDAANDVDATYRVYMHLVAIPGFAEVDAGTYMFDFSNGAARVLGEENRWKAAPFPSAP